MSDIDSGNTVDLEALKALQADAQKLECIESLHARFNVFEALGFVDQELIHSRFLAFLFDPNQNHGLEDLFLKRMLREALTSSDKTVPPVSFGDLDSTDLSKTLVQTEHHHIDILLANEDQQLAVIIENKVWTTEHSDQLNRYYQTVNEDYPDYKVIGIYLTPYGSRPSHAAYVPVSYDLVCGILDDLLVEQSSNLSPEVQISVKQYIQMVRKRIVGDSEIARLCQQIYQKHKQAFDLVYEHRFVPQEAIRDQLKELIAEAPDVAYEGMGKTSNPPKEFLRFRVQGQDVPALSTITAKTSGRILRFVVANRTNSVDVKLEVPSKDERIRQRLFTMVCDNLEIFKDPPESVIRDSIFVKPLLSEESHKALDHEEHKNEISEQWTMFLEQDLPQIEAVLSKEAWIWESSETDGLT